MNHKRISKVDSDRGVNKRHQTLDDAGIHQNYLSSATLNGTRIDRKASCACGGGCPSCSSKPDNLRISQPDEPAEIEADLIADRVMRMPISDVKTGDSGRIDSNRETEAHRDGAIKRKPLPSPGNVKSSGTSHVADVLGSAGHPLDQETREFFETRLGYDLSSVRIHTDSIAGRSARAIDARAYTLGRDIVFGSGEYDPRSEPGRHLIAHELAHTTQDDRTQPGEIRRMTMGSGSPPADWATTYGARAVPDDERERVKAAIARVKEIVDDPGTYTDCIAAFIKTCTTRSPTAFVDTFNNAILWRGDREGALAHGDENGNNIMYTESGYDQGAIGLAQTLVHEMGHNCGVTAKDDHYFAEVSANYCIGPLNYFGLRFGFGLNTGHAFGTALVYRRLFDLALGGQLQATIGADLDTAGLTAGILDAEDVGFDPEAEFEFGSVNTGLRARFNPNWGGEGFGGITAGVEGGLNFGRFRIARETEEDEFEYGPGVILQSTLGAEFYIPTNPHILQFAPEAGYRLVRPLNPEAENIHELVFGFGGMF